MVDFMQSYPLILFDIGGVLFTTHFRKFYETMGTLGNMPPERFMQLYNQSGLEKKILSGMDIQSYFSDLGDILKIDGNNPKLRENFPCFLGAPINEMIELKKQLHEKGYPVGLFSNMSELTYNILSSTYQQILETWNGPAIFSFQARAVKTDDRMFRMIEFSNVIYIDDNCRYVSKGINHGWKGIHFTPYIDPAEAIRASEEPVADPHIKTANSAKDVIDIIMK